MAHYIEDQDYERLLSAMAERGISRDDAVVMLGEVADVWPRSIVNDAARRWWTECNPAPRIEPSPDWRD